ncbi:MAG: Rpn family recombination-promoting nuclease/putative transposase [Proteobacteria bacterium]|nr:Rpn family recombination-promoting nuclease/putative transposase [Pseudomonadota bacterium]
MGTYINPFTDFGFKRLFGQKDSKVILIGFLNALFEGEFVVTDLVYRDKEQLRESPGERCVIYDIFCTTDKGEHFILEMQNKSQKHFEDRALYYVARGIVGQGISGDWNYDFNAVFGIYLMNFTEKVLLDRFRNDFGLRNLSTDVSLEQAQVLTRKLRLVFLQLPLFNKTEAECKTDLDKWTYILKNMETLKTIPWQAEKDAFEAIAQIGSYEAMTEEERNRYDDALRIYRDSVAVYQRAYDDGVKKGERKGVRKGVRKVALELLKQGFDNDMIAKSTELSEAEIEKLRAYNGD